MANCTEMRVEIEKGKEAEEKGKEEERAPWAVVINRA